MIPDWQGISITFPFFSPSLAFRSLSSLPLPFLSFSLSSCLPVFLAFSAGSLKFLKSSFAKPFPLLISSCSGFHSLSPRKA